MTVPSPAPLAEADRPADAGENRRAGSREAPFFIVGSGRSGTTLLRMIMLGHSRLHISPETHFIRSLVRDFPLTTPLAPEQLATVVERIVAHPRWKYMEVPAEAFRAEALALTAPLLTAVLNLIYHRHLRDAGKVRFGDKTPDYIGIVPELLALYPDARFIHLIRDGHDVAISFVDVGWGHAYQGARFEWTHAVRCGTAYRTAPFADRILEVRYEDMVRDVEGTVRRICAFLGETFEPAMLDRQGRHEPLVAAEWQHIHRKLAEPIPADAAEVWRRKLSAIECFLIEASLHRDLERLGYRLRFAGPRWRPLLGAAGAVLHALAPLLDRALPALQRRNYLRRPLYI